MASHKTKKRLALLILIVGLPIYIVVASSLVTWLGRPPILVELLIYIVLGIVWALPFKWVFLGVGQEAPDQNDPQ
ncbi:MAG: DUF2842 domain-containing protein [Pseudomonadota bacterium]|jgi:hypothetical protein|uniref:DUF2842 domain-containing protein n=1 Tax=Thalassococcus halodurans TaxID=373675 RepID=A0A1H5SUJ5_9RHOB|nr:MULTISPECIES: DUF2842 domain-containing protein [Thalassococcus]MBO6868031.1 DUF2842 domain-containing protein [Thalassococcus sp.]MEC8580618.1 DUF2842 domain-containing protein [Pseudomonadota bacterium]SEF53477.1 Protein of unknown function [Thalassococcus halodurans]